MATKPPTSHGGLVVSPEVIGPSGRAFHAEHFKAGEIRWEKQTWLILEENETNETHVDVEKLEVSIVIGVPHFIIHFQGILHI